MDQRRALLLLARSVNALSAAVERVKPEAVNDGATLLTGSFKDDLTECRAALADALRELD